MSPGADTNARTREPFNQTPLHLAAANGHVDIAALLVDRGMSRNGLYPTVDDERLRNWPRAAGADVHAKALDLKSTPLHIAAEYGHVIVAALLLDRGMGLVLVRCYPGLAIAWKGDVHWP
jgi:ankyrin repeat protein